MIDPVSIEDYFLNIATTAIYLQHTSQNKRFAYNIDELKTGKKGSVPCTEPTLILDEPNGQISYNGAFFSNTSHGFWVLKVNPKDDWAGENTIVRECNEVAKKILAKMVNDFELEQDVMIFLDPDSITFEKAGPEITNLFGVYYRYLFRDSFDLVYNAGDYE